MVDEVPLRTYRLSPRKARLELQGTTVSAYVPAFFSRHRLRFNATETAVADLSALSEDVVAGAPETDVVFERAVSVPYLFTTGPLAAPNLVVLFNIPQRVPPLRAVAAMAPNVDLPFGFFSTRSSSGETVDGLLLRAQDPQGAAARLRDAGAQVITDPDRWLAEHRSVVVDDLERERLLDQERAARRLLAASNAAMWVAVGSVVVSSGLSDRDRAAEALVVLVLGLVALVAMVLLRRLAKRASS